MEGGLNPKSNWITGEEAYTEVKASDTSDVSTAVGQRTNKDYKGYYCKNHSKKSKLSYLFEGRLNSSTVTISRWHA